MDKIDPRLNQAAQGKHVQGSPRYLPGRSILTDPDPQALLDQFAGTGSPVNTTPPGQPGFRERVFFGKVIGEYVDPATGTGTPIMNGIIHYGRRGAHIVPAAP